MAPATGEVTLPGSAGPDPRDSAPAPERPSGRRGNTLAKQLAETIEAEIIALGWPVGHPLGSEPELMERYGVSRSVFRQAVRLLESRLVAEMRRGRGGGLFVTRPDPGVVSDAVARFLRYSRVNARDLFEVRQALELTSVRLAAERASEDDVARLRKLTELGSRPRPEEIAERGAEFHIAVAEISGNSAIHLFIQVVTELTEVLVDHEPAGQMLGDVERAHDGIVDAIASLDPMMAQRRMIRHFQAMTRVGWPDDGPPDRAGER
jgi:DNA-binding FadR family transcriptional regulator